MGLSIVIDHEPGRHGLHYAFIIFLYALNELPHGREELFIEVGIEKFIALDHFGLCGLEFLRGGDLLKGIIAVNINGDLVSGADCDELAGLALDKVISSDAFHQVGLVELAGRDSFLDHPPLIVEVLLCEFVLADVLQKLEDVYVEDLLIDRTDLYVLSFPRVLRIFFGEEHPPDVFFEFVDGLYAGELAHGDVLCAKVADYCEGKEVLLPFLEDWMRGELVGIEQPVSRGAVFVQKDSLGNADRALEWFFE